MEPTQKNLADYLGALRRYRGRMLGVALALLIVSVGVAFGLPPVYRSNATILIEQQEIPEDLVRSTITSFADQRIQVISQRVMTRANLTEIIKKYDLYADDRKTDPMEVIIEQMRKDIKMNTVSADVVDPRSGRPTVATIAFTISFDSESQALAQKVANELVSLYLNENIKSRSEMTAQTSAFLTDETAKLAEQIATLESQLATFKEDNAGQLPELVQLNMQLMDRTEREIADVDREIRSSQERKIFLDAQLAQIDPMQSVFSQGGERVLSPADRLKSLQTKYLSMSANYGENFPDLVKLRKEMELLRIEVGKVDTHDELYAREIELQTRVQDTKRKYAAEHPDVKRLERELEGVVSARKMLGSDSKTAKSDEIPDNPAYIQLTSQVDAADTTIRALQIKRKELVAKLTDYEQRLTQSPQVEREFREMSRGYDNAWAKYKELKAKQMEAQLAQVMETERKGERFTLIEPPELPEKPLKPNRMALLVLGVIFSFAGGVGTVAVSENMDNTVRGARTLTALLNLAPLGAIPFIETPDDVRKQRRRRWTMAVTIVIAVAAVIVAAHLFYKPLDVLWYVVLRRLGM